MMTSPLSRKFGMYQPANGPNRSERQNCLQPSTMSPFCKAMRMAACSPWDGCKKARIGCDFEKVDLMFLRCDSILCTRPEPQSLLTDAFTTLPQCQCSVRPAERLQGHKHHGPPDIGSGIVRPKESLEHGSGPPENGHTGDLHRRPWRELPRSDWSSIRSCPFTLPLLLWH
jgi:hypothetical protein